MGSRGSQEPGVTYVLKGGYDQDLEDGEHQRVEDNQKEKGFYRRIEK